MALTWKLSEIRTKFRNLTGLKDTSQMTDDNVDNAINDFYQNVLPEIVKDRNLVTWFTQELTASDAGSYDISADVLKLLPPYTINESKVEFYGVAKEFWDKYPEQTGGAFCITSATLAEGTTTTKVANSAFKYEIQGYSYSKAAAETALSGDTIPQSKYGIWRLEINSSGTISIVEGGDNATGYATPGHALAGLQDEASDKAPLGYVIVINTSSTFVPGTTGLDASGVTATYTNGFNSVRSTPDAVLVDEGKLYVRPKADRIMQFKCHELEKPTALSGTGTPTNVRWGPIIAYGAALENCFERGDVETAARLQPVFDYYVSCVNGTYIVQKSQERQADREY